MERLEVGEKRRPGSTFALPVSVEQVAVVIKQMGWAERQRLLKLVPELRQATIQAPSRTPDEIHAAVKRVRAEVMQALGGQPLSPTEPFLGDLTLGQYMELPDEDRARLWDEWAGIDLEELEELDVRPEAVSAG
jgi:hypothetical protein